MNKTTGNGIESRVERDIGGSRRGRRPLKLMGQWIIARLGGTLSRVLGNRAGGGFGILTYHRMTPKVNRSLAPTWNVTPERFRQQLLGLLSRGYRAWPLRTVLDFHREGRPIPPRIFVVTFDDGYENVYRHAWPVLCELLVPATIFLATAYLDSENPFPFDDWAAAGSSDVPSESWKPLTTNQCAEMLEQGLIDLGCHTHTHAIFRNRPEALGREVTTSLEVLRTRFGLTEATFSFPFGIAGPILAAAARRAGVLCGLTSEAVLVRPYNDPFMWGRFNVEETDTASMLVGKLEGWYSLARRVWLHLNGPLSADKESPDGKPVFLVTEKT